MYDDLTVIQDYPPYINLIICIYIFREKHFTSLIQVSRKCFLDFH